MQGILQYEESLIALNIANSSDCRISKKIPHFACFPCKEMLQSEESDLNMKNILSFLRLLVMRGIPCSDCLSEFPAGTLHLTRKLTEAMH